MASIIANNFDDLPSHVATPANARNAAPQIELGNMQNVESNPTTNGGRKKPRSEDMTCELSIYGGLGVLWLVALTVYAFKYTDDGPGVDLFPAVLLLFIYAAFTFFVLTLGHFVVSEWTRKHKLPRFLNALVIVFGLPLCAGIGLWGVDFN